MLNFFVLSIGLGFEIEGRTSHSVLVILQFTLQAWNLHLQAINNAALGQSIKQTSPLTSLTIKLDN